MSHSKEFPALFAAITFAGMLFMFGSCGGSGGSSTNADIYTNILYSNNFDTNSSPTYSIIFGSPQIVGPIGQFTTNSLAFNSAGNLAPYYYDQISYRVDELGSPYIGLGNSSFHISFDIITSGLTGSSNVFVVLFDTPTVRRLVFSSKGDISIDNYGTGNSSVIASYANYEKIHMDIYFDIKSDLWKVYTNDQYVYGDAILGESLIRIRFSHGAESAGNADFIASAYIDNILISAVPL